ncbi:MAG: sulfatase-like hydrolase/transferase [Gammaproteobacteria bacterium]|uniref:sulfatase family protein n=1 Tax=Hydrogenophaga sp. TaxID=1904254 RepID=UPI0025C58E64|nr:sulfatase-like hydrolase/transferase [Hydrogenophaga sp.]MBU4182161.1 sulfatase-like hydrolase/transferase [Gammaproteobacteria bacterium]MBU4282063.1 sulfatase-like hydrolase/transferase [Gammaproteobacteria bacterium]MBU4323266.1 sulfatase-like hydrolase/transferase [Gammaproteobacteria bacterium]MBU4506321.1 sulfatase-like hydrolase/transferase [Gammaproteobacteria bacterium]MCG2655616.1 sulfatase-like hydrolase/transferase [Hydrogenophaga sp.]
MSRPNIIYIVSDDLGYADLGCYGGREGPDGPVSPNVDALAAGGLKLTEGYANSPVCSPTRFAMITMRYQYRLRGALEEPINSRSKGSATLGLPPEMPTLPSLLKDAGYRTALIGKWHLGYPPHFGPLRSGYEEFFGIMAGGVDYFTHCSSSGDHDLYINDDTHKEVGYLTDVFSNKAVEHVRARAAEARDGTPFFLSLHYTAPHWPWETRDDAHVAPEVAANLFHLDGGNVNAYRRMIHHMDEGIGWITAALREEGLLENTLIVFTSDNGGERFSDNWPLVGGKMDLTEGGIRVPWVAHWPATIPAGSVSEQHAMTMDWSATLLALGGGQPHPDYPLDGVSLEALLRDPAQRFERPMHWRMNHRGQRALREGDWKYLMVDGHEYLFNIPADARERANLAKREPVRLARLRDQWLAWDATMPPIPADATVSLGYGAKDMPQR